MLEDLIPRLASLGIGYILGTFLTAEVVARHFAHTGAANLGDTGNPGMANIMASLGFVPGILTLVGDLAKTLLSAILAWYFFGKEGWIVILYAGLGTTLGHDFPFWRRFRGGKGVATTSLAIGLYHFPLGLLANLLGMGTVFATKYLCIAGPVIPICFALAMAWRGDWEAFILSGILSLLSVFSHMGSLRGIKKGTTKKTDVLAAIQKKRKKAE